MIFYTTLVNGADYYCAPTAHWYNLPEVGLNLQSAATLIEAIGNDNAIVIIGSIFMIKYLDQIIVKCLNDHEVAGFVAGPEKQECSAGNWLQDAARNQFFLGAHIMIQCLDSLYTTRTPASGVFTNIDSCLCVYADSHGFRISIRHCIHLPDVFKDCVGF